MEVKNAVKGLNKHKFFILLLSAYVVMSFFSTQLQNPLSDSWIYMNLAKAIVGGQTPYKDFFYAHQPLFLYALALFYWILGVSINTSKVYAVTIGAGILCITYLLGEHIRKNVGLIAVILLTGTYVFAGLSNTITGTMQTLLFGIASIYLYFKDKPFWSGFSMGLALLTRLDALIILLPVMVLASCKDRNLDFFKGLSIIMLITFALAVFMPNYITDTVVYHLEKTTFPSYESIKQAEISNFIEYGTPLLIISILGILYVILKHSKEMFELKVTPINVSLIVISMNALYALFSNIIFIYYLAFMVPFLSLIGAYFLVSLLKSDSKRWFIVVVILAVYLFYSYDPGLKKMFTSFEPNPMAAAIEIVVNGSTENDTIFDFESSPFAWYMSFITDRGMPPVDTYIQRAKFIDPIEYEDALRNEGVKFVLWNLEWSPYREFPNFNKMMRYVKDNFYVRQMFIYEDNMFFLAEGNYKSLSKTLLPKPMGAEVELPYSIITSHEGKFMRSPGTRVSGGDPSTIGYFSLNNDLLAENHTLLKWPLMMPLHWTTQSGNLVSDSWVTRISGENAEIATVTYNEDTREYTSFILVSYDHSKGTWAKLYVFQNVNEKFLMKYGEELV